MADQGFDYTFGIGQIFGTVIFERIEKGRIEAVGPLDRLGLLRVLCQLGG